MQLPLPIAVLADSFFVAMAVTVMAGPGFASLMTLVGVPVLYHTYFRTERKADVVAGQEAQPAYN